MLAIRTERDGTLFNGHRPNVGSLSANIEGIDSYLPTLDEPQHEFLRSLLCPDASTPVDEQATAPGSGSAPTYPNCSTPVVEQATASGSGSGSAYPNCSTPVVEQETASGSGNAPASSAPSTSRAPPSQVPHHPYRRPRLEPSPYAGRHNANNVQPGSNKSKALADLIKRPYKNVVVHRLHRKYVRSQGLTNLEHFGEYLTVIARRSEMEMTSEETGLLLLERQHALSTTTTLQHTPVTCISATSIAISNANGVQTLQTNMQPLARTSQSAPHQPNSPAPTASTVIPDTNVQTGKSTSKKRICETDSASSSSVTRDDETSNKLRRVSNSTSNGNAVADDDEAIKTEDNVKLTGRINSANDELPRSTDSHNSGSSSSTPPLAGVKRRRGDLNASSASNKEKRKRNFEDD
ncbi:hypothetical protein HDU76_007293 [Blyttiomyces sp. JEL0837]|nr:hypothetical protein HDU76_007293 [Blyttiomyces sp. JEL0837]